MKRLFTASVMAVTLSVTTASLADDAPAIVPIPTPTVAAPATVPAASGTVIAAVPVPTVAAPIAARVPHVPVPVPVPVPALASPAATTAAATPQPAAAPPVAPAPPFAPAPSDLPLALRPSSPKPLTLATEPTSTPWPYKLLFGAAVLGACAVVWKKRRSLASKLAAPETPVRVLGKTSMGLRGELALVEVGGMRILVGVTPSSMQTLAVLPDDYAEAAEQAASRTEPEPERAAPRESRAVPSRRAAEKERFDLATRARSLFSSLDVGPPIPARVAASGFAASRYADERDSDAEAVPESAPAPPARGRRRPPSRDASRDAPLEGQARGIALALGSRK